MADHPHTIDRWDDATGENLIEQIAAVGDYLVALATYRAAVQRWPLFCKTGLTRRAGGLLLRRALFAHTKSSNCRAGRRALRSVTRPSRAHK